MASVNKVILVGYVGEDPKINTTKENFRVGNFNLATREIWEDKRTKEKKDKTEWHRVSVMNDALVDVLSKYVQKGTRLYVEGKLQLRKWTDQKGTEHNYTEIMISPYKGELIVLSEGKNSKSDSNNYYQDKMMDYNN